MKRNSTKKAVRKTVAARKIDRKRKAFRSGIRAGKYYLYSVFSA